MATDEQLEALHFAAQGRLTHLGSYHRWILRNFGDAVRGRRIWDAGAGIGIVAASLAESADFVLATEYSPLNLSALQERFGASPRVRVEPCDLSGDAALAFREFDLDTVISLDVIEHLQDDLHALRIFREVLSPAGRVLIKVPAHPLLFGAVDVASAHFRRYRKAELRDKLARAGFEVERITHMNMAATLPYFVKSRVLKRRTNFSNSIDPNRLGLYDRLIPWLERAERILPVPFGLSLIAVGRKPA
jgi:2-polyprenyl-3-methyl-5-hydroxy-6-metoxy-1,4-benzoquinol methylase